MFDGHLLVRRGFLWPTTRVLVEKIENKNLFRYYFIGELYTPEKAFVDNLWCLKWGNQEECRKFGELAFPQHGFNLCLPITDTFDAYRRLMHKFCDTSGISEFDDSGAVLKEIVVDE